MRRIFLATTATTNLMSLNPQPVNRVSASTRQANVQRQSYQYRNDSSNDKSFDKIFDKFNDAQSSMDEEKVNISSGTEQETEDPTAAVVSTSAQGESKDTQDAPQKESQSVEEASEIEDVEEPSSPKQITVMNLYSFVSMNIGEQSIESVVPNPQNESKPNLMTIMPQSQESNNKSQDMLNLLAGRTWKINPQNQLNTQQVVEQTISNVNQELPTPSLNQQIQIPNQSIENPLQGLPVQRNFAEVTSQVPLTDVNLNVDIPTEEPVNLQNPIPSNLVQSTNIPIFNEKAVPINTMQESAQILNGDSFAAQVEGQEVIINESNVDINLQQQAQPQPQQTLSNQTIREQLAEQSNKVNQPIQHQQVQTQSTTTEQVPLHNNQQVVTTEQPTLLTNEKPQLNQQVQNQPTIQNNNSTQQQAPTQNISPTQMTINDSSMEMEQPIPVHQTQPQQVTYQPQQQVQQSQLAAQVGNTEMPQVQAAIVEGQSDLINRQQPNQSNLLNTFNVEVENDSQVVNPSQQMSQQQPQNQQQNFQSQMQQAAIPEVETESSSNVPQQAPTENFAAHLGAAVNSSNSEQPINVASDSLDQTTQTARQEANITTQIVEHARMIRNAENTEMVIHLKPEHLGELTLRVSATTNGSVNVTFHSENAQVRSMIENTLVQLKQELSNQGLKVDNVQVSAHLSDGGMMNGRGQQAWEQNQRGNNNSRVGRLGRTEGARLTAAEEAEIVSTAIPENTATADGVDYRV